MSTQEARGRAVLRSPAAPNAEQLARLTAFLEKKYDRAIDLQWQEDRSIVGGFRIEFDSEVIDWTVGGGLRELKEKLSALRSGGQPVIPLVRDTVRAWVPEALSYEVGSVLRVADGIAYVDGLERAAYGEILLFENGVRGMVQDLRKGRLGCILFGDCDAVRAGGAVRRTGRTAGIGAGEGFLGRVVDSLGAPIDGGGEIHADAYRPIENPAPDILDRQPVNRPLETGILSIDSMFPIGRGQRELIIGDRQTGKTSVAVDTILNQKGKDVVCVYVAIGQKASSVAQLAELLRQNGAMDYTAIVCAAASDSASMQYIAPYAGCALGEYFMEKGRDVLIVYDDLSKHATSAAAAA